MHRPISVELRYSRLMNFLAISLFGATAGCGSSLDTNPHGLVTVHYVQVLNIHYWYDCNTGLGYSGPGSFGVYMITKIENNQPHAVDFTLHLADIYAYNASSSSPETQDVVGMGRAGDNTNPNWFHNCNDLAAHLPPVSDNIVVKAGTQWTDSVGSETIVVSLDPNGYVKGGTALRYISSTTPGLHLLMSSDATSPTQWCDTATNASLKNFFPVSAPAVCPYGVDP